MTALAWLAIPALLFVLPPLLLTLRNLSLLRRPDSDTPIRDELVTVAIPARNEADNLETTLRAVLASGYAKLEVLVYDDDSTDATPNIIAQFAAQDDRVRAVPSVPLPDGWVGKQHACFQLGQAARGDWILFLDADVTIEPAAVGSALHFAQATESDLVSTFPRQITRTLGELIHVPMMFFVLLSYLPFQRMRDTREPAVCAACGQFILARRKAYLAADGHRACAGSMHDGVQLPRALRRLGSRTDLFDGTHLASVRMYRGFFESWAGFAKNTFEGIGSFTLLAIFSVIHALAHVLPWALLPVAIVRNDTLAAVLLGAAVAIAATQRLLLARRFRHTVLLAALHPLTVLIMTLVQWHSAFLSLTGRRAWRGRRLRTKAFEQVVLVDEDDQQVGVMEKIAAHEQGGRLHRAFSVFVTDHEHRVLLQQRASTKYHFGGLWTNTACGHPRPGESTARAGHRRLFEEMGIRVELRETQSFTYEATHDDSGLIEREIDHVLLGTHAADPVLNPEEASDFRWVSPAEIDQELAQHPERFTPWFPPAWAIAREHLHPDHADTSSPSTGPSHATPSPALT